MESDTISGIVVFIKSGVVDDITGIPKGEKVTVVDWDINDIDPKDLTDVIWDFDGVNCKNESGTIKLKEGKAQISTWRGESLHQDQLINLEKLKEYMASRDTLECYVLTNGTNANRTIIKPDSDRDTILVLIDDDGTEEEFESLDDMAENHILINMAFRCGAFYVYGHELGGY